MRQRVSEDAMRPIFAALITAPLLAGCATPAPQDQQAAPARLVGQSEADLVRQLGVPTRAYDADGHRFLAYLQRRVDVSPGTGPWAPFWGRWGGGSYGPDVGPEVVDYICETTFEIAGGKVQSFQRRGNACG
jgi:hypothetical protein